MPVSASTTPDHTVRVSNRRWLRLKLHFLVERDEKGMKDFRKYLDDIGGKRLSAFELYLATELFCRSGDSPSENDLTVILFSYLVVPVWSWRRLKRLTVETAYQLYSE